MSFVTTRRRASGCPSNLELDELMAGDCAGQVSEARLRSHLEGCGDCRARLEAFSAVEPPTWSAAARRPPARRRFRWVLGVAVSLATATAALLLLPRSDGGPGEMSDGRTKGGLALTAFVKRAAGAGGARTVERIDRAGEVRAGDELRFSIVSARPGYATVLGLDAAPAVTVYVPAPPAAAPVAVAAGGPLALPGSVVADETGGFERVVVVVCDAAQRPSALRDRAAAALARAGGRPERVPSLETGCAESSLLLRKGPSTR